MKDLKIPQIFNSVILENQQIGRKFVKEGGSQIRNKLEQYNCEFGSICSIPGLCH